MKRQHNHSYKKFNFDTPNKSENQVVPDDVFNSVRLSMLHHVTDRTPHDSESVTENVGHDADALNNAGKAVGRNPYGKTAMWQMFSSSD